MEWRTVEIRDEKGDGFDTVQCEDLVFPKQFLHIQPDVRMKDIKEFKYRDGDVLICSYPKTGTHWVFNLVHFLMAPGPVEQKLMPSPRLLDLHPLAEIEQLTSPRVAITHLKPNRLPVEHLQARGKIILLARNPRDTMVSHMYHTQRHEVFNFSKLSWDCFFDNWTKGQIPTGSYFDYYNNWEKSLQEQNTNLNVHIVFYENLIKDGLGELKKLQQFLGVTNTEDRLNQILDRCSWRRIKVDVKTGEQPAQPDQSELTRKGVIGHWRVYAENCDHTSDCKLVDCNTGFRLSCYRDNVCTCIADYNTLTCTLGTECQHAFGRCTHGDHSWHCIDSKCHCRT